MTLVGIEVLIAAIAYLSHIRYVVNMLSYAIPFFMGVMMVAHPVIEKIAKNKWTIIASVIVYTCLLPCFDFNNTMWTTQLIRIILGCSFIVFIRALLQLFDVRCKPCVPVCWLGKYSLAIYLLHGYVLMPREYILRYATGMASWVAIMLLLSIVTCFLCVMIARIVQYIPVLDFVLFGKKMRKLRVLDEEKDPH